MAYEPNSLDPAGPRESPRTGFASTATSDDGPKTRQRPESFADHYSQARLFYRSLTAPEQGHIAAAIAFEQAKVETEAVRQRVLGHLAVIDADLLAGVCKRLGVAVDTVTPARPARAPQDLPLAASLSQSASRQGDLTGRAVAVLVADGVEAALLSRLRQGVQRAGARLVVVAPQLAGVTAADGSVVPADHALDGAPSCLFDAVAVMGSEAAIQDLGRNPAAADWVRMAWRHLKAMGHDTAGAGLLQAAGVGSDAAVVLLAERASIEHFTKVAASRHHGREGAPGTDR